MCCNSKIYFVVLQCMLDIPTKLAKLKKNIQCYNSWNFNCPNLPRDLFLISETINWIFTFFIFNSTYAYMGYIHRVFYFSERNESFISHIRSSGANFIFKLFFYLVSKYDKFVQLYCLLLLFLFDYYSTAQFNLH